MSVQKKIAAFAAVFILIVFFAPKVYANSAEPPEMVIWSVNAPSDTELVFIYSDGRTYTVEKSLRLWEKCYFLYGDVYCSRVTVKSSEKSFELDLPDVSSGGSFSRIYTLDYNAETLTANISPLRAPIYMLLRVLFTLVIECGFYYLAGYRKRRSYIAFAAVNLVTQTFVNFVINGDTLDVFYSYTLLVYIGMEVLVFIAEMIALPIAVKEKKAGQTVLWTFAANTISMIIGGTALLFVPF